MAQTEQPKFKILSKHDDIEIRNYDPAVYAPVTIPSNSKEQSSSFRILAGYIFGGNDKNQKIAMTAPVHMHKNEVDGNQSLTMRFVMPEKYRIEDLSIPNDKRIEITKSIEKKYMNLDCQKVYFVYLVMLAQKILLRTLMQTY